MARRVSVMEQAISGFPLEAFPVHVPVRQAKRLRGAFFTPSSVAEFMAEWLLSDQPGIILEPSFGDGIFLNAVARVGDRFDVRPRVIGAEIDASTHINVVASGGIAIEDAYHGDFMSMSPSDVNGVIGNPPFVRLRHLPPSQRDRALSVARRALGHEMDPSGSLWMPFVLHAMEFLRPGGRLAMVLPFELTYVRYARPLWSALRRSFGRLQVLRVHERLFPDLLQDVVILLAEEFGAQTNNVEFRAYEWSRDLFEGREARHKGIAITDLLRGERGFMTALLSDELSDLLASRIAAATVEARDVVTFNIGYVAGDKGFFHPSQSTVQAFELPSTSLRPALTSTRALKRAGLNTSSLSDGQSASLYLPDPRMLSLGERRYIAAGEASGVSSGYKCRIRSPWYIVPGVRTPDVVLSVFSEKPILLVNDGGYAASNSLLCGFCRAGTSRELAAAWYTSLTLLQCELEVHSLGGGVMVFVPQEASNIRLSRGVEGKTEHLAEIDQYLRSGKTLEAYREGNRRVLIEQVGLSVRDIELIEAGIETLSHWRTSIRSARAGNDDETFFTRTRPKTASVR